MRAYAASTLSVSASGRNAPNRARSGDSANVSFGLTDDSNRVVKRVLPEPFAPIIKICLLPEGRVGVSVPRLGGSIMAIKVFTKIIIFLKSTKEVLASCELSVLSGAVINFGKEFSR